MTTRLEATPTVFPQPGFRELQPLLPFHLQVALTISPSGDRGRCSKPYTRVSLKMEMHSVNCNRVETRPIARNHEKRLQSGRFLMADLEDLLLEVSKGDTKALSELYDRLAGIVNALALRVVGDPARAENTVQRVFLTIWKKAPLYDASRASAKTWIITIARNQAIDEWRRQKGRLQTQELDRLNLADTVKPDPLSEGIRQERSTLVREALDSLPREQKQPLLLAYFSGLSHSQIAQHLETPLGTVKTRIQLGMDKLRRKLRPRLVQ